MGAGHEGIPLLWREVRRLPEVPSQASTRGSQRHPILASRAGQIWFVVWGKSVALRLSDLDFLDHNFPLQKLGQGHRLLDHMGSVNEVLSGFP